MCMSSIICVMWPVARGSYVGGNMFMDVKALVNARSYFMAIAHQGTFSLAAFSKILSSMSVTLRIKVTVYPLLISQRRRMSKLIALRICPICGAA